MRQVRKTTMFFAVTCFAIVCAEQVYAAGKAPSLSGNGCQVQVTGAVTTSWKGVWQEPVDDQSANVGATSDYWFSELDLKEVIESFVGPGEDKARKIVLGMRKNPRFVILLLNCMTDEGRLFLRVAPKSIYKDVPRAPKSYKIAGERKAVPGQFVATGVKVGQDYYFVTEGHLDIKKFNFEGVAGTFSLKASPLKPEDKGKDINLDGIFNFPCTGVGSRCKLK
jgi:hypothetical protein